MSNAYNCIDVSEFQKDIDWKAVKADGVEYAIIRSGWGKTGKDKYFEINMEGAKEAGIKIGVYFYSYATDYDSAVAEAKHCIELIEGYKDVIDLPIFYDVEEEKNIPRITDVCMGFINTMNYYGYNCGIYTSGGWYSAYFKNISTDYIWLAYLGATKPEWCDIWQYNWKGRVDGITGDVDLDIIYNKDMKLLINSEPEPSPVPDKEVNITVKVSAPEGVNVNINVVKE